MSTHTAPMPAPPPELDPALVRLVEALARLARARQLVRTQEKPT